MTLAKTEFWNPLDAGEIVSIKDKKRVVSLGKEIYQRNILPKLGPEHHGKFVVIDVKTGDYVIHDNDAAGLFEMKRRRPDAFTWTERVGFRGIGLWAGFNSLRAVTRD